MAQSATSFDFLNLENDKSLKKQLEADEIKRKIPSNKITALTISKIGSEFVIHVPDEYDYRYASFEKKDRILQMICKSFCNVNKNKTLPVYYKAEESLEKYTTTKPDKKSGISRIPTENPVQMNEQLFAVKTFISYIQNYQKLLGDDAELTISRGRTGTLFSRNKGEQVSLDDFNLLKVLGRGAFGKVTLSEKKSSKELFAIKSLRKDELIDKEQIENTKTEKMILEHVNHPFLVNLAYCFQTEEKIFFVLKFMKGGELFQHLRQSKRFEENRAKFYAAQVLSALGHLHSKDIVYRDIKPENILMDEEGNVCLTDFGMAKRAKKDELFQSFVGTPEYLAPEILTNEGHSKTVDWWTLGILIYEMIFGIPPFYNQNQNLMFEYITENQVKFPNNPVVTTEAKDLISKLLIKMPQKRLGAQKDAEEIKSHPWFKDIDFKLLEEKKLVPPFKPNLEGKKWEKNFDEESIQEDPSNSLVPSIGKELIKAHEQEFKNF